MHYKRVRRNGTPDRLTTEQRFFSKIRTDDDGCWIWQGGKTTGGYGHITVDSVNTMAHRWSYEFLRADIPDGLELDHLCRVPACVNPWHLEPVTPRINLLRGNTIQAANAAKTECLRGHPFDEANTYRVRGSRECRACRNAASRRQKARRSAGANVGG